MTTTQALNIEPIITPVDALSSLSIEKYINNVINPQ